MDFDISFRKMTSEDVPSFLEIRNECKEYLHNNSYFTLEQAYEWFNKTSPKFFIIQMDNKMIGYFRTSNWEKDSLYIGADIHSDFRGKGIGYESYLLFIQFLKNTYGIKCIKLEVLSTNIRAKNLYSKLGFKQVAISDAKLYRNDQYIDSIVMELKIL